jgi:hypothetical protein
MVDKNLEFSEWLSEHSETEEEQFYLWEHKLRQ